MKKTALFLALTVPALAQAEKIEIDMPDFYGKLNLSVQNAQEKGESFTEVKSNASRLGVKGKGELNHGLTAFYQVEYQTNPENGVDSKGNNLTQRNSFAGLKGGFGKVQVGMFDTPLKKVQKKVDLFNDLEGDIKYVITKSDNRAKNSVQYTSPRLAGLQLKVDQISAEDPSSARKDATSSSLTYKYSRYYVGVAYDSKVEGNDIDVLRVATQVKYSGVQLGALWEEQDKDGKKTDGWLASASYKLGDIKLKAQYGESDIVAEGSNTSSVGADYKLGKGAKAFVYYTVNDYKAAKDANYGGAGIEYKF